MTKTRHLFKRWTDLNLTEKANVCTKTRVLFEYLTKHPNQMVSYEAINNMGLNHLYKFHVNDYNFTHNNTEIMTLEDGVILIQK